MRNILSMQNFQPMRDVLFPSRHVPVSWVPPAGRFLAYLHGGRIFTETLPRLGMVVLLIQCAWFGSWWMFHWAVLFRDFERWRLVTSTVAHLGFLALAYLLARIIWLRLDQLKRLPADEGAALRSFPILFRLTGEAFFILAVGVSVRNLLTPAPSSPPVLGGEGALSTVGESLMSPALAALGGFGFTASIALYSLLTLVFCYGLANVIETYQAIELNTRPENRKRGSRVTAIGRDLD